MFEKFGGSVKNGLSEEYRGAEKSWNNKGIDEYSGSETSEMVWTRGENE